MSGLAQGTVLLGALLAVLEWRRRDRTDLGFRLAAAIVTALALAELARPGPPLDDRSALPRSGDGLLRDVEVPTEVGVGEPMVVQGTAGLASGDSAWVVLEDPTQPRDSVRVAGPAGGFELADRPRAVGGVEYRLRLEQSGLILAAGTFGIAVRDPAPPAVLLLDASPNFETNYLKRWLSERGGRVTVRTAISRSRFRTEQLNGSSGNPARLTPGLLDGYDALLLDAGALDALDAGERRALRQAIENRGLGLLITADAPRAISAGEPLLRGIQAESNSKPERRAARLTWPGAPRRSRGGIEVEGLTLKLTRGVEPLIQDESGRVLAAGWQAGSGRIAVTLVRTPSRWQLDGDAGLFSAYWSRLLSAVARDTVTRAGIREAGQLAVDRPATIELLSAGPRPVVTVVAPDSAIDTLALARDPFEPRRLSGRYWPRVAGWHAIRLASRDIPFRVANTPDDGPASQGAQTAETTADWRRQVAFALLLLSLTTLWAESRRRVGR